MFPLPREWSPPCGGCCTRKYAALVQIPWRVFCKKGCDADGLGECNEICYKDPVLKNQQWSAYIDRSPGDGNYSLECFHACVAGCGFKFDMSSAKVDGVQPNRPLKPPPPKPAIEGSKQPSASRADAVAALDDMPCTLA